MAVNAILCAIDELESNGLATRPWAMAGLYLGICERCPAWTGDGCSEIGLHGGQFGEWLCDRSNWCDRWTRLDRRNDHHGHTEDNHQHY